MDLAQISREMKVKTRRFIAHVRTLKSIFTDF